MQRENESALMPMSKPLTHQDVTDLILLRKMRKKLKWSQIAEVIGQSKEWSTAACLGQMQMTEKQAKAVADLFELPEDAVLLLQTVPYKGSLRTAVPTDPLIYRLRGGERLRHYAQGADPRGIRRRHHERDRFLDGPDPRAQRKGRSRQHRDERKIPALQIVLTVHRDTHAAQSALERPPGSIAEVIRHGHAPSMASFLCRHGGGESTQSGGRVEYPRSTTRCAGLYRGEPMAQPGRVGRRLQRLQRTTGIPGRPIRRHWVHACADAALERSARAMHL